MKENTCRKKNDTAEENDSKMNRSRETEAMRHACFTLVLHSQQTLTPSQPQPSSFRVIVLDKHKSEKVTAQIQNKAR